MASSAAPHASAAEVEEDAKAAAAAHAKDTAPMVTDESVAPPPAAAPPSPSAAAAASPSSAPSSPQQQQQQQSPSGRKLPTKLERLYILLAHLLDHTRAMAASLPPQGAPDTEVDDVEVTAFTIEHDRIVSVFQLEYGQIARRSLEQFGLDLFHYETVETVVAERRRELAEGPERRELTGEEEIAMRRSLQETYEAQRRAKKGSYPKRKTHEDLLREKMRASQEARQKKQ